MSNAVLLPLILAPRFLISAAEDEVAAATADEPADDESEYD